MHSVQDISNKVMPREISLEDKRMGTLNEVSKLKGYSVQPMQSPCHGSLSLNYCHDSQIHDLTFCIANKIDHLKRNMHIYCYLPANPQEVCEKKPSHPLLSCTRVKSEKVLYPSRKNI